MSAEEFQWKHLGNCRGFDPDVFFPGQGEDASYAKSICHGRCDGERCAVLDACLEHALVNGEKFGIWGGASERERRRMRRARALRLKLETTDDGILHGTEAGWLQHVRLDDEPCDECTDAHEAYLERQGVPVQVAS